MPEPFTCRWCGHEMTDDYLWCPECGVVPEHVDTDGLLAVEDA